MNAHIPQSYEAAVELGSIAAVQHQIITPRDSKPVIGVVQDTLVGAYRLTRPGNLFNKREFFNLMMWNKRFDGQLAEPAEQGKWSGAQVMSTLLPPLNLTMKNKLYNDAADADKAHEDRVNVIKIKEGEVLQGTFDKDVFSKAGKGIIHVTYNDYGSQETVTLLDTLQNTIEQFLIYDGFSVGISDLVADDSTRQRMEEEINLRKKKIEEIILQVHQDTFNNNTGKTNRAEFEDRVFTAINEATKVAGKIGLQSLADENRMTSMIRAGSKGSEYNVAQMIACVGQQGIEGKRVPYGFTDRTLPHFKKYDDGGEARGFIESSFVRGLTPSEFFFHAMSGREGLIDTAVKTADTGYIQRQLVKSMEDLITHFDGSVRDAKGNIIQFHYGEDGISATKIEGQGLPLSRMTEEDIRKTFSLEGVDFTPIMTEGTQREEDAEKLTAYVEQVLEDRKMLVETMFGSGADTGIMSPVNLERILTNLKVRFGLKSNGTTDLTPLYVLNGIDNIISRTQSHNALWQALLRFHLSPHNLIVRDRFTKKAFDTLLEFILVRNWKSWAIPGEQVGIIAAQSIGEPATQMSVTFASRIVINSKNMKYAGQIGPFIDALLEKEKDRVIDIGNNSVVLDLVDDLQILGVSADEKTSWKNISQISRHPANGGLVEIVTRSGRKTTATLSHSFLKRSSKGVVPVLGSELKVGMRVPVAKVIPEAPYPISSAPFTLNKEFGWVCGIYLADGSFNGNTVRITKIAQVVEKKLKDFTAQYNLEFNTKNYQGQYGPGKDNNIKSKELKEFLQSTFGTGSYEKFIGSLVYHAPVEFIRGVIGGFFDGDGNVNPEKQLIRASSRSKPLIQGINHLLGYCEMFGIMSSEESVRMPDKTQHTLMIPRKYAEHYKNTIGFELEEKSAELDLIIEYNNRDDIHSHMELVDKIPELGEIIANTGKLLRMPGCSRTYGRWTKKESIGRRTLQEYIQNFKDMLDVHVDSTVLDEVTENIRILESAADADVLWDEIVELNYLPDPKEFVYDFTIPGNETFMVDDGILVHNTLNTFHLAGVAAKSNVTRGVPRLKELLKVTKNPKATTLTVYLRPEFRESKEKAREVSQDLELTLLKDITAKAATYYDPKITSTVLEEDKELLAFYNLFEERLKEAAAITEEGEEPEEQKEWSRWMLRLEFDREKMFNKNISMDDIAFVLNTHFGEEVNMVYSDYNSQKLIMRIRLLPQATEKGESSLDDLLLLKKFQNKILNGIVIRGVTGIKSAPFRFLSQELEQFKVLKDGKYDTIQEYVLDTDGSNFLDVVNHPSVDGSRVISSHVHDILPYLGIEAARATLISEMTSLFSEIGINYRHVGLLTDVMTRGGRLMSIDRYGINKMDIGPLAKASFEETEKILLRAAVFGEMDPVTGVSANIMTGQAIRGGTAFSQILLDEAMFMKLQETVEDIGRDEEKTTELDEDLIYNEIFQDPNDRCSTTRLKMNMVLPNADVQIDDEDVEINILD